MGHPRRSFRLYVYGHLVMPEHVQLLLSEPQRDMFSDRTLLPLFRVFEVVYPTRSRPSDANTKHKVPFDFAQGRLSTPQIIAFAMISSGRDDRVGDVHALKPKPGLSRPPVI